MLEALFAYTSDLPGSRRVTIEVEGENGYNLTGTLKGLRAYHPKPKNDAPKFNQAGVEGWELVGCDYDDGRAIFKRRLGEKSS